VDWRSLRHLDPHTTAVREQIEHLCQKIVEALNESWVPPEERRRMEEAEAQRRAEEDARRLEAEAERQRKLEEAAVWQRAEEERRREKVEAKRIADEEERHERAEAEAEQAEAKRLADEEEWHQKRAEAKALILRWRAPAIAAALLLLVSFPGYMFVQKHMQQQQDAKLKAELEKVIPVEKIERSTSSSNEQIATVEQRVILYDEDENDSKGKKYVGSAIWRTESIKASGNQKADVAVRADIEIPDRKLKMTMSFRRNTDSSLPASHTAELWFKLPQDFFGGGIGNVPGILMKSNEQARGTALSGIAVKVSDGFFLVGLSDSDRAKNLQLLKERSWFDVLLVYTNQRRAIISFEKGAPGEIAFNDAFAAWGE